MVTARKLRLLRRQSRATRENISEASVAAQIQRLSDDVRVHHARSVQAGESELEVHHNRRGAEIERSRRKIK